MGLCAGGSSMRNSGFLRLDFAGMLQSDLNPRGWTRAKLAGLEARLRTAKQNLAAKREHGGLDFSWLLPEMKKQVGEIQRYAAYARAFQNFVVLGIGGSALGPQAVQQALNPYYYNELPTAERGQYPRFYAIDNVDPVRFANLLAMLDLRETLFNVITKSGNTSETMAQYLIIRAKLQELCGPDYAKHIVVTTDGAAGNLLPLARQEGYQRFVIPAGIGGRFSELTPVGLLPAAVCGIDIDALLDGALAMDAWIREENDLWSNPAQFRAASAYLAMLEGKNISVFMPYADGLKTIADWYAQLWAESLGKRFNRQGQEVWVGQTPVKALGVTDQHSQVQLYVEGPNDKIFTFLTVEQFATDVPIPWSADLPEGIRFLGGHTLGELLAAEEQATEYALSLAGRQHQRLILPELSAWTVGQLLVLLEWETAYAGELLNVNAFDQPGVEEGKIGTYALMGRPGYEQRRREIARAIQKSHVIARQL